MFCSVALDFVYFQFTSSITFFEIYCCCYYCVSAVHVWVHACHSIYMKVRKISQKLLHPVMWSVYQFYVIRFDCWVMSPALSLFLFNDISDYFSQGKWIHTKYYLSFVLTLAVTSFFLNQWLSVCTKAVGAVFNHLIHDVETYSCIRGIALKNSLLRKSKVLHSLGYLGSLHSHHSCLPCICFLSHNLSSN